MGKIGNMVRRVAQQSSERPAPLKIPGLYSLDTATRKNIIAPPYQRRDSIMFFLDIGPSVKARGLLPLP